MALIKDLQYSAWVVWITFIVILKLDSPFHLHSIEKKRQDIILKINLFCSTEEKYRFGTT